MRSLRQAVADGKPQETLQQLYVNHTCALRKGTVVKKGSFFSENSLEP